MSDTFKGIGHDTTTVTNLGTGDGVYAQKDGAEVQLKTLKAGTNITITPSSTELLIAASGGGGGTDTVADANLSFNNGLGTKTVWFRTNGKRVIMEVPELQGTADGSAPIIFTLPEALRSRQNLNFPSYTISDNDGYGVGLATVIHDPGNSGDGEVRLYNRTPSNVSGSFFVDGFSLCWTLA